MKEMQTTKMLKELYESSINKNKKLHMKKNSEGILWKIEVDMSYIFVYAQMFLLIKCKC